MGDIIILQLHNSSTAFRYWNYLVSVNRGNVIVKIYSFSSVTTCYNDGSWLSEVNRNCFSKNFTRLFMHLSYIYLKNSRVNLLKAHVNNLVNSEMKLLSQTKILEKLWWNIELRKTVMASHSFSSEHNKGFLHGCLPINF